MSNYHKSRCFEVHVVGERIRNYISDHRQYKSVSKRICKNRKRDEQMHKAFLTCLGLQHHKIMKNMQSKITYISSIGERTLYDEVSCYKTGLAHQL
jgi:hypothetical protein